MACPSGQEASGFERVVHRDDLALFGRVQDPLAVYELLWHPLVDHPHATGHGGEGGTEAHRGCATRDVQDDILRGVSQAL
jgi:hypothetical protein